MGGAGGGADRETLVWITGPKFRWSDSTGGLLLCYVAGVGGMTGPVIDC